MEMQLPHLLVVVISSIKVNIFVPTGKNYSGFAVLREEHYGKLISAVLIWMVFSTWVQLPALFLPKTLEKGGHLHHASPGKPGGCCPAGRQSLQSDSIYSEKEEFLLPGATSSSSCLAGPQQQKLQFFSMVVLPPWRLSPALPRGRKLLPPPGALD